MVKPLNIRDISIIDAFPVHDCPKTVLNVGCGGGRIDWHLSQMGYRVFATDLERDVVWEDSPMMTFHVADVFDLASFPVDSSPIVLCAEVLEHLAGYKTALRNLLTLTSVRLIIGVPFEHSFNAPAPPPLGHCNYWSDRAHGVYKDINEFKELCHPHSVSISKIRTKPEDVAMGQWSNLVVVDKRQSHG